MTTGDRSVESREAGMKLVLWKASTCSAASVFKAWDTHAFLSVKDTQK